MTSTKRKRSDTEAETPAMPSVRRRIDESTFNPSKTILVTVGAGESAVDFHILEEIVRPSSAFFENAMKEPWRKSEERAIRLPSVNPEVFALYAKWLLYGRLYTQDVNEAWNPEDRNTGWYAGMEEETCQLYRCYQLGDLYQDLDFKDCVLDVIIEILLGARYIALDLAAAVYAHTNSSSPARKLCVDLALYCWGPRSWRVYEQGAWPTGDPPHEFCKDLSVALRNTRDTSRPSGVKFGKVSAITYYFGDAGKWCQYHEHSLTDKPCYRTRFAHLQK